MYIDAIVAIIILFTMVQGYRKGFVFTLLHMVSWIFAVVLGFVFYPKIVNFINDKTSLHNTIHTSISNKLMDDASSATSQVVNGLPSIMQNAMNSATNSVAVSISDGISNIILNIIGFMIIIVIIKLISLTISTLFSKKSNQGIIGGLDGLLGLLAGGIKGVVIVFIFLALLVPITSLWGNTILLDSLNDSYIARDLYDNNLIFVVLNDFLK